MPKNNKVSKLKSWDDCPHTKKKETKIITDLSDNTSYEICKECGILRRVYPTKSKNLKVRKKIMSRKLRILLFPILAPILLVGYILSFIGEGYGKKENSTYS